MRWAHQICLIESTPVDVEITHGHARRIHEVELEKLRLRIVSRPRARDVLYQRLWCGGAEVESDLNAAAWIEHERALAVVDDVKVWTTTYQEKVAEAEYRDASGNKIGTAAVYEDRTQVHTAPIWYPVQGKSQLADEDFFRIAGDQASLDETMAMRNSGRKWRKRGMITLGASLVGMIGSYFIPNPTARIAVTLGATVGFAGGYYMTYWGAHQLNPETHAVDRSVADRAAIQYTQKAGGGVSLNKDF